MDLSIKQGNLRRILKLQEKFHKKKKTVADYPKLVKEWHPTQNGTKQPKDYKHRSNKKVWWRCSTCNYEWKAICNDRTSHGSGCPTCANQVVSPINNLEYLYPEIAKELHPNNDKTADKIIAGSNKKYKWLCSNCNHEWKAACNDRTGKRKTGCPACANQVVSPTNNLEYLYPEIAKELHPDNKKTAVEITAGSAAKYKWFCSNCSYIWISTCNNRTSSGNGCPICNDPTKIREKWEGWEKFSEKIAQYLYPDSFRIQPRLPNNKKPDLQFEENNMIIIADAKTHPYILGTRGNIEKSIENYLPYCNRLEFWCLDKERETEIRDGKEIRFINADDLLLRIKEKNIQLYETLKLEVERLRKWKYEPQKEKILCYH